MIKVGDQVRAAAGWLKSCGIASGPVAHAKAKVVSLSALGEETIAKLSPSKDGLPESMNVKNLVQVGEVDTTCEVWPKTPEQSGLLRIKSIRPLHYRQITHAVHPAPVSRPHLRTGSLKCGHPFVDESKAVLLRCNKCAGEPRSTIESALWAVLADVVSKPHEVPPPCEDRDVCGGSCELHAGGPDEEAFTKRPVIRTRVLAEGYRPPPPPNAIVACSLCGGKPTLKTCPECKGTKQKWRYGPRVYPKQRTILFAVPTLEDVRRMGFSQTGALGEQADERRIGLLARAWSRARTKTEKWHWAGELGTHGWFPPTLSAEELLRKYPRKVEEEPKKVVSTAPHWSTPGKKFTKLRPKRVA